MTKPTPPNPWGPWMGRRREPLLLSGIGCVVRGKTGLDPRVQVRFTAFRDRDDWDDERIPLRERLDGSRVWWDEIPSGQYPAMHVGQVWRGDTGSGRLSTASRPSTWTSRGKRAGSSATTSASGGALPRTVSSALHRLLRRVP